MVPISASRNEGINELIEHAMRVAVNGERPRRLDFCSGPMHRCIHAIAHMVEDHAARAGVPMRFAATKLVEGDPLMLDRLALNENERELMEHAITEMEFDLGTDREAALADMRYDFIGRVCSRTVVKGRKPRARPQRENRQPAHPQISCDPHLSGHYGPGVLAHLRPDRPGAE